MLQTFAKSILLLIFFVVITCIIYPLTLWAVGQSFFPFQANGSIILNSSGKPVGSKLIAQAFTKNEYFQPRPSAASYNASASSSSSLAASNYALRNRIAGTIGPLVKYANGNPVAPDIMNWFQQDKYQDQANIVAQWANLHNSLAQAWVSSDAKHASIIDAWSKSHRDIVMQFVKDNPQIPQPKAFDLAVVFFQNFSKDNPGKFPLATDQDIQIIFFDMWRQDHPDVALQDIPADLVTTSSSGLDPHISLYNAEFQLERVAHTWTTTLKRNYDEIKQEIRRILLKNAQAPLAGLGGEKYINVLEVNLELQKQYGATTL